MTAEKKVFLVTGASRGIGRATALGLARMGHTVGMVCRDISRGEAALAEIRSLTGNDSLHLFIADLTSRAEVHSLAAEIQKRYERVDVLVNNAGALFPRRELTADGLEMTFALNHMGYFRLTHFLLDLLTRSAPARIVNIASDAHRFARLDFADLQNEKKYVPLLAYAQSKLANVLFTRELARQLDGSGVTVNAMHPGTVRSNFYSNATGANKIVFWLFGWAYRSPEKGAETVLHLATAPQLERTTGGYFRDRKLVEPSARARDSALARRLWETSATIA